MPLAVGTRFGPYEIAAPLGAEGSGIWKATDPDFHQLEPSVELVAASRWSEAICIANCGGTAYVLNALAPRPGLDEHRPAAGELDQVGYAQYRRRSHQTQAMPINSDATSGAGARVGLKKGVAIPISRRMSMRAWPRLASTATATSSPGYNARKARPPEPAPKLNTTRRSRQSRPTSQPRPTPMGLCGGVRGVNCRARDCVVSQDTAV